MYNEKNLINTYVITLKQKNKYIQEPNYLSLTNITNRIKLLKGVILTKEQQDKYSFYAKSSIAITFAHIKAWKYIKKHINNYNTNNTNNVKITNYSIIFEDDAILNIEPKNFYKQIINICENIDFDIYKLHSDFSNGFTSMAAYIINHKSIDKLLNLHKILIGHLDFDLYVLHLLSKIKMITHKNNIFITEESTSSNRIDKYLSLDLLSNIYLGRRCDKNLKQLLTFKVFRIMNYEIIVYEIILIILLILFIIYKKIYLIITIIILLLI